MILSRSIWDPPKETAELTGYVQPAAQIRWLKRWGIEFSQNGLGYVFVTESQFIEGLDRQVVPGIPPGEETAEDIRNYQALMEAKAPLPQTPERRYPKRLRTPVWADQYAIDIIYAEARRLTKKRG